MSADVEHITAADAEAFRAWLDTNHDSANAVWLEAEALIVPSDLARALAARDARGYFDRLAPGTRRGHNS